MLPFIPFNKPYMSGNETRYIEEAVKSGKISGDGLFTKRCHNFFEQLPGFQKTLLTTSCTDALELAALLLRIQPGDEIIMPAYTFVSTANAFMLRGARIVFVDSTVENPNMNPAQIEELVTPRTRAIVPVHYAGIACDMDPIMALLWSKMLRKPSTVFTKGGRWAQLANWQLSLFTKPRTLFRARVACWPLTRRS